jgi:ABC-type amino acid transport substrate-binding protein
MPLSRHLISIRIIFVLLAILCAGPAHGDPVKVALREEAPFAFRDKAGEWQGIAVDLWNRIAEQSGIEYSYEVYPLAGMLEALETAEVDAGVAALTISADREKRFDFTQPFMTSSLVIATKAEPRGWWQTLRGFVSLQFLSAAGALAAVLLAFGFLVWVFERKKNEQFGGKPIEGIGAGFWWSAVTMTTVGYGDKVPVTMGGRIVGLVWMFSAIIIISGFTAAIASSLTMNSLRTGIESLNDLRTAEVGVIQASSGAAYLDGARIDYQNFATSDALIEALANGRIDAAVHDAPILKYALKEQGIEHIKILPDRLRLESYAFGLKENSPHLETINRSLLEIVQSDLWPATVDSYLEN